jgi:superfamily I DNA/RNA helicase
MKYVVKQCLYLTTDLYHSIPHKVIFKSFKLKLQNWRKIDEQDTFSSILKMWKKKNPKLHMKLDLKRLRLLPSESQYKKDDPDSRV